MVDHAGRTRSGHEVYVWDEMVEEMKDDDEFHGIMRFPSSSGSTSSFLEVGEEPDPQDLSPAGLQCYCKFKKPKVETTPASAFNNKEDGEDSSFIQTDQEVSTSGESGRRSASMRGSGSAVDSNALQPDQNEYSDSFFDDALSYQNRFVEDEKKNELW